MMDQEQIAPKKPSDFFREIADKIDKNDVSDFAGAFILVPPASQFGVLSKIEGLIVGPNDPASFWAMVKLKIDVAIQQLDDEQRNQGLPRRG